jgi:HSP20 family protein
MARQDVRIGEEQDRQSRRGDMTQSSQQGGLARRNAYNVIGLAPGEFFRMNPFSLLGRMTEEMDRVFGEFGVNRGNGGQAIWAPPIEISEQDGKYTVRAELPGLKPEEVKVEVADGALVLEGERKFEKEEEKSGVYRSERRYGRFYRAIPLPEGVNPDQANARFENGVLEVTVPIEQQRENRRQIPVQSATSHSPSAASSGSSSTSGGASERRAS